MSIAHITFEVDKEQLVKDLKNLKQGITGCSAGYTSAWWEDRVIGPRDRTNSGFIDDLTVEQKRITEAFGKALGVPLKAIYTTQRPNKELYWHTDPKEMKCAINFVISGNQSPITFKDAEYMYEAALVDVSTVHMVKPQPTKRILFKLCIDDLTFEEAKEKLKCSGLIS